MLTKTEFDNIIRENIHKDSLGYELWKNYDLYYSKEEFEKFKNEMETKYPLAYQSFGAGKGGEFEEHSKCGKKTPPKMASIASSSRFCYLALRDGAQALGGNTKAEFEFPCEIEGVKGTPPQLDAYIPSENIFVEAKCHEIFDRHKMNMKKAYWNFLFGEDNDFGLSVREYNGGAEFEIPISEFDADMDTMFDVKQFLCHLLGVSSKTKSLGKNSAKLVYIFFKPDCHDKITQDEIDEVFQKLQKEIKRIFESVPVKNFIIKNNIVLEAVAEKSITMQALTTENIEYLYR